MRIEKPEIDAVITWVDGKDKHHYKKRLKVLNEESGISESALQTGTDETRFIDNGELAYCVKSIRKYAPWIRTIHIVSDNQTPDFATSEFQKEHNVRIVDHTEILESYEWALPTFNSRTIETALWRIKGLADHFIYFNDDFVLTNDVHPDDFFKDGNVVLRGRWNLISSYGTVRMKLNDFASFAAKKLFGITRSMHLLLQIKSAEMAGFKRKYFRTPHVPQPVIRKTLESYFAEFPERFEENIQYKFRNTEQFTSIYLANHLEIKKKNAILKKPSKYVMLNGEMDPAFLTNRKLDKLKSGKARFLCLHGMEAFNDSDRKRISFFLDENLTLK